MGPLIGVVGAILGGASVLSGIAQTMQGKEAAEAVKDQNRQRSRFEEQRNIDMARQAVAKAQIARASIQAQAVNSGATGSGMEGAMGSTMSHLAFGFGRQAMEAQTSRNISRMNENQMKHEGQSQMWGVASQELGKWSTFMLNK